MSLKYCGLLFVLIVIVEAINGLALNETSDAKIHTADLPAVHSATEKSHSENGPTTAESLNIIIPNTSKIISVKNQSTVISTVSRQPITDTTPTPTPTPTSNPSPSSSPSSVIVIPPSPAPAPEKGYWVVLDDSNKTVCIIAQMAMQLNITDTRQNQGESSKVINVPKNAEFSGNCSELLQSLTIKWGPGHFLQINFSTNKSSNNFYISEFSLSLNATIFKDNGTWSFVNKSSEFMTPINMSYKCSKPQDIKLKSEIPNLEAVLTLKDTQFEAYMNKTKVEFGAAQDCDMFDTPDIVPIAVGCALAILVIVVLVAYLIGRKRSLNRGYLSM